MATKNIIIRKREEESLRGYEEDGKGEIKRWTDEVKHGCEYDGVSLETSLQQCDKELEEHYTTGNGRYAPLQAAGAVPLRAGGSVI